MAARCDQVQWNCFWLARIGSLIPDGRMAKIRAAESALAERIQSIFHDVDVVITPVATLSAAPDSAVRPSLSPSAVALPAALPEAPPEALPAVGLPTCLTDVVAAAVGLIRTVSRSEAAEGAAGPLTVAMARAWGEVVPDAPRGSPHRVCRFLDATPHVPA